MNRDLIKFHSLEEVEEENSKELKKLECEKDRFEEFKRRATRQIELNDAKIELIQGETAFFRAYNNNEQLEWHVVVHMLSKKLKYNLSDFGDTWTVTSHLAGLHEDGTGEFRVRCYEREHGTTIVTVVQVTRAEYDTLTALPGFETTTAVPAQCKHCGELLTGLVLHKAGRWVSDKRCWTERVCRCEANSHNRGLIDPKE